MLDLDEVCPEYPEYGNHLIVENFMLWVAEASARRDVDIIHLATRLEVRELEEPFTEAVEAALADVAGDPGFFPPRRY